MCQIISFPNNKRVITSTVCRKILILPIQNNLKPKQFSHWTNRNISRRLKSKKVTNEFKVYKHIGDCQIDSQSCAEQCGAFQQLQWNKLNCIVQLTPGFRVFIMRWLQDLGLNGKTVTRPGSGAIAVHTT